MKKRDRDKAERRVFGRFHMCSGDVNWLDYGGTFVWAPRDPLVSGPEGIYHFLEFVNMEDALGEEEVAQNNLRKYGVHVRIVHIAEVGNHLVEILRSCDEELLNEIEELGEKSSSNTLRLTPEQNLRLAYACFQYGACAYLWDGSGDNWGRLVRTAKEVSMQAWKDETRAYLSNVINKIGTTNRDLMRGDMYAGLEGKIREGDKTASLFGKILLNCGGQTLGGALPDSLMTSVATALKEVPNGRG